MKAALKKGPLTREQRPGLDKEELPVGKPLGHRQGNLDPFFNDRIDERDEAGAPLGDGQRGSI